MNYIEQNTSTFVYRSNLSDRMAKLSIIISDDYIEMNWLHWVHDVIGEIHINFLGKEDAFCIGNM